MRQTSRNDDFGEAGWVFICMYIRPPILMYIKEARQQRLLAVSLEPESHIPSPFLTVIITREYSDSILPHTQLK